MAFCFFESGVFWPRIFSAEAARKRNISEIAKPRICDFQVFRVSTERAFLSIDGKLQPFVFLLRSCLPVPPLFLAWRFEVERTKSISNRLFMKKTQDDSKALGRQTIKQPLAG